MTPPLWWDWDRRDSSSESRTDVGLSERATAEKVIRRWTTTTTSMIVRVPEEAIDAELLNSSYDYLIGSIGFGSPIKNFKLIFIFNFLYFKIIYL